MSGVTVLRGSKKGLSIDKISGILFEGLLIPEFASRKGLQDYVRAHLLEAFSKAIDFGAKANELVFKSDPAYADYFKRLGDCSNPEKLREKSYENLAKEVREWPHPYRDITAEQWKNDKAISEEYVRRVIAGEEPILSHFLYEAENEIRSVVREPFEQMYYPDHKVERKKAEKLVEKYKWLFEDNFPEQTSFLPIRDDVTTEKYFELYRKLCDEEPPFPESICARILCISTLRGSVLGSEGKKKLVYNKL